MMYATLEPELYRPSISCPGYNVRLSDDLRKSVVFIGTGEGAEFTPNGTGFWVSFDGYIHLVTAKHVVVSGSDPESPFSVRLNTVYDRAFDFHVDPTEGVSWSFHPDSDVDVAVMLISAGSFGHRTDEFDVRANNAASFVDGEGLKIIGNGDLCYTVGLFSLFSGERKNVPVVHSGNIALLSEGERIPIASWDDPGKGKSIDAHLVDQRSLGGLSGAPVYVRPVGYERFNHSDAHEMKPVAETMLLGMWHGAWNAVPDQIMSLQFPSPRDAKGSTVGVGMGVVIPAHKIMEVLEMDELKSQRDEDRQQRERDKLATPQSIPSRTATVSAGDDILKKMLNTPPKSDS